MTALRSAMTRLSSGLRIARKNVRLVRRASIAEQVREDRADRAALAEARAKLDSGDLDTVSHEEMKARLGL